MIASVVIPTCRRNTSLRRAIRSIFSQTALRGGGIELVIVDNDPAASARQVVAKLASCAPVPTRYVHEPNPGVANARNAGVAAARSPVIAFLDDDQTASPQWLQSLLDTSSEFDADVVFGPIDAIFGGGQEHADYFAGFFSRKGPPASGVISDYHGTGNSLVLKRALPTEGQPFDPSRNTTGGEDSLLFETLRRQRRRFAWSADALAYEHPSPERLRVDYSLRRAFSIGQSTPSDAFSSGPRAWPLVVTWMLWGAAQACVFSGWALLSSKPSKRVVLLDHAFRGLGKLLWFPPFKLNLYSGST